MIERNEQNLSPSWPRRWVWLALVLAALVVVAAAGGHLAQAEPLAPSAAPAAAAGVVEPATLGSTAQMSETIFMPLLQACLPLQGLALSGPETGTIYMTQTLRATLSTASSLRPVTYTWWVGDQPPIVHAGELEDSIEVLLERTGQYPIAVEAANACGTVRAEGTLNMTTRGLIAFERLFERPGPLDGTHDIMLMDSEGSGLEINLTNTPDIDEGAPTWSPDGNWLAYSAGVPGQERAIYKLDLSSGERITLTDGVQDERWPDWSPLGDRIAFMRNLAGLSPSDYYPEIWVMDADGGNQQQLTHWDWKDEFPAWSPDGQWIAFSTDRDFNGRDLWKLEADNPGHMVRLTTTPRPNPETDDRDEIYPSWSPDGWIYHTFVYSNNEQDESELLYRVRDDGTGREKVFDDGYNRYIPSFSPDGACFVFYSYMGGSDKEVWKWCQGFTQAVNLTDNEVADEFCAWSPVP